jgi:hypothetical protein
MKDAQDNKDGQERQVHHNGGLRLMLQFLFSPKQREEKIQQRKPHHIECKHPRQIPYRSSCPPDNWKEAHQHKGKRREDNLDGKHVLKNRRCVGSISRNLGGKQQIDPEVRNKDEDRRKSVGSRELAKALCAVEARDEYQQKRIRDQAHP